MISLFLSRCRCGADCACDDVTGIYMVVLILTYKKSKKRNSIIYAVACCVCWLIPLIIVIVDGALKLFGLLVITMTGKWSLLTLAVKSWDTSSNMKQIA